jgi:hypothetical protein
VNIFSEDYHMTPEPYTKLRKDVTISNYDYKGGYAGGRISQKSSFKQMPFASVSSSTASQKKIVYNPKTPLKNNIK